MARPTNVLHAPLGQSMPAPRPRRGLPKALAYGLVGSLSAVLLIFAGWVALISDPLGGEPVARVSARATAPTTKVAALAAAPAGPAATATPQPVKGVINIIDGSTGQRRQFEIGAIDQAAQKPRAPLDPDAGYLDLSEADSVRVTPVENRQTAPARRQAQAPQRPTSAKVINVPQ